MAEQQKRIPDNLFSNVTTSYKFFWWISIIEIYCQTGYRSIEFKRIFARMIANVFSITREHKISLGKADQLCRSTVALKNHLGEFHSINDVYGKITDNLEDIKVHKILSYYNENVPYRFLTPWTGSNIARSFLSDRVQMYNLDAPYRIDGRFIVINPAWDNFLRDNKEQLLTSVIDELFNYIDSRNSPNYISRRKLLEILREGFSISPGNIHEENAAQTLTKDNIPPTCVENGKIVKIDDPRIISEVSSVVATDRLKAISILANFYSSTPGITMGLRDWNNLIDTISPSMDTNRDSSTIAETPQKKVIKSHDKVSEDKLAQIKILKRNLLNYKQLQEHIDPTNTLPLFEIKSFSLSGKVIEMECAFTSSIDNKRYIMALTFKGVTFFSCNIRISNTENFELSIKPRTNIKSFRFSNKVVITCEKATITGITPSSSRK